MSALLIIILMFLAICLAALKYNKSSFTALMVALVCFIAIGNGYIPSLLLKQLQTSYIALPEPEWKNKNAIVLLGAGAVKLPATNQWLPSIMAYPRITETARLYLACIKKNKSCTIIISGGDALKIGKSEAEEYKNVLLDLGIKPSAILLESNSMNTFQNAEFTSRILNKIHVDQVILVTSGIHLKRALLYFSSFSIKAIPALADYLTSPIVIIPLGYNFAMADFAIHEYLGIARFYIYNYLGWNTRVTSA